MLPYSLSDVCTPDDVCIFKPSPHWRYHRQPIIWAVSPYIFNRQHINIVTVNSTIQAVISLTLSPSVSPLSRHPLHLEPSTHRFLTVAPFDPLLNNDGSKRVKGATEEDKKEPNGFYEMGLTDPYPWADKGRARLVQRSIMDRHYEKLRWNLDVNRILAQRGF